MSVMKSIKLYSGVLLILVIIAAWQYSKHRKLGPETRISFEDRRVILHRTQAQQLFNECVHLRPDLISGYWVPTEQDIDRIDTALPMLAKSSNLPPNYTSLLSFYRQYVGYMQGGRKKVHINAFLNPQGLDWKEKSIPVCKAKSPFFVVEYDIQTHKFDTPLFSEFISY